MNIVCYTNVVRKHCIALFRQTFGGLFRPNSSVGGLEDPHENRSPEIMKILAQRKMLPTTEVFAAKISAVKTKNKFEYSV
jgi:hypothetical protein